MDSVADSACKKMSIQDGDSCREFFGIDPKFIRTVEFEKFSNPPIHREVTPGRPTFPVYIPKSSIKLKILRVKNCPSLRAMGFYFHNYTNNHFTTSENLFVVMLELLEKPEDVKSQVTDIFEHRFQDKRPVIVQIEAPNGYQATFFKGYKNHSFHELSSQDLPEDVAALKEMLETHGSFNGDILASKMCSIAEKSSFTERMARSVLCLRVMNLYDNGVSRIMPWIEADWVLDLRHLNAYFAFIDYPFVDLTAVELAWQLNKYDLVATFIERDSMFPRNFDINQIWPHVDDAFKQAFELRRELHKNIAIAAPNIEEVSRLLSEIEELGLFKHLKRCYNELNDGLVMTCLRNFNADIYELLLQKKIKVCSNFPKLPEKIKRTIAKINAKFFTPIPPFLSGPNEHPLISKCWLSFGHSSQSKYSKEIDIILKELEKTPESKQLLEFALNCPDLKIVFDFKRHDTFKIDPSDFEFSGPDRNAGYFNQETFVIAFSAAPRKFYSQTVSGAFTRFLAQLALHQLYQNDRLPFRKNENEKRQQFNEVVAECRSVIGQQRTPKITFTLYEDFYLIQELISRVPEILLEIAGDWDFHYEGIKTRYPKLFNFYSQHVVPDLDSALSESQPIP